MSTFNFADDLVRGEAAEDALDAFFARWYAIERVSMDDQRRGVDRIFTCHKTGRVHSVEYKADFRTEETGNIMIETISVVEDHKPGWYYTCEADILIKYVPGYVIYQTRPELLREGIDPLDYHLVYQQNDGYRSQAAIVPEGVFAAVCEWATFDIDDGIA